MDGVRPEMGTSRWPERHGDVRERDITAAQNADRHRRGISERRGAAISRHECRAGDYKTAGDRRAESRATGHPVVANDAIRHADMVRVGAARGRIVLVNRVLGDTVV